MLMTTRGAARDLQVDGVKLELVAPGHVSREPSEKRQIGWLEGIDNC